MKQGSTLFLKAAAIFVGLAVLALCTFVLSDVFLDPSAVMYRPFIAGLYVSVIPFLGGIYQILKLLQYIDTHKAFSDLSVRALKNIKLCALVISVIYIIISPYFYILADTTDAPGIMVLGLMVIFASWVVAGLAAVVQQILQQAIEIKSENDLTV